MRLLYDCEKSIQRKKACCIRHDFFFFLELVINSSIFAVELLSASILMMFYWPCIVYEKKKTFAWKSDVKSNDQYWLDFFFSCVLPAMVWNIFFRLLPILMICWLILCKVATNQYITSYYTVYKWWGLRATCLLIADSSNFIPAITHASGETKKKKRTRVKSDMFFALH